MTTPYFRRDTCRLCGGAQLEAVVQLVPTPIGDDFVPAARLDKPQPACPLDLMLCRTCGHVQLLNVVDPEAIYREYTYVSSVSLGLVSHFQAYAESVLQRVTPAPGALVVEIGSNEGAMLRAFQARGLRVLGVDPAREIAQRATAAGIETWPTYFTVETARQIRDKHGPAAIVVANNVMANIDDVAEAVAGVRHLLAPDGIFVFETSYWLDVVEKSLLDTIFHEHLSYFAVGPLETFFRRQGLGFMDVERVATKGGSLRGFVQLAVGPWPTAPAVADAIAREEKAGLGRPETYQALTADLQRIKTSCLAQLSALKAQGKTIAAYGAAVGLTTMVYYFGLAPYLSFIVDDNPDKYHTFSPGHHLPVLPSAALYGRRPDVVVILAWRYAEPILQKHGAFRKQGGQFMLLMPEVKVV